MKLHSFLAALLVFGLGFRVHADEVLTDIESLTTAQADALTAIVDQDGGLGSATRGVLRALTAEHLYAPLSHGAFRNKGSNYNFLVETWRDFAGQRVEIEQHFKEKQVHSLNLQRVFGNFHLFSNDLQTASVRKIDAKEAARFLKCAVEQDEILGRFVVAYRKVLSKGVTVRSSEGTLLSQDKDAVVTFREDYRNQAGEYLDPLFVEIHVFDFEKDPGCTILSIVVQ